MADLGMPDERGSNCCSVLFVSLMGTQEKTNPAFTAADEGKEHRAACWQKHLSELRKWLNAQSRTRQLSVRWHKAAVDTELAFPQVGEPRCRRLRAAPSSGCNPGNGNGKWFFLHYPTQQSGKTGDAVWVQLAEWIPHQVYDALPRQLCWSSDPL